MNIQTIELDLEKRYGNNLVTIGQGDVSGTTIRALVYDNGAEADLTGASAYLVATLPDKRHYYRGSCSIDGNAVTHVCNEEKLCSIPGYTDAAYIEISIGGSKYSTERFAISIEKSALEGKQPAANWDNAVTDMINRGESAIDDVEQALDDATAGYEAAEAARNSSYSAAEEARNAEFDASQEDRDEAQAANDAAQAKNNADQALNNQSAQGLQVVKLTEGQYDPDTLEPTIEGSIGKLYFVPIPSVSGAHGDDAGGDEYIEWMWIDGEWERVGMSNATLVAISTDEIDAVAGGTSKQGEGVLNLTGLSYLWTKLKAAFAAVAHKHSAADITSGTLALSRGGTGKTSAMGAQNALLGGMGELTSAPGDTGEFVMVYTTPNDTQGAVFKRKITNVWPWFKAKTDALYATPSDVQEVKDENDQRWDSLSQKLWFGSWSSGSITVPGLSGYTVFAARPNDTEFFMFGLSGSESTKWRLGGVYVSPTPNVFAYAINAERQGDTLTLSKATYANVLGSNTYDFTISEIWGIS